MAPQIGLDFNLMAEINRKKTVHILEGIHGTMDLVIDPELMKPLDTFIQGASTLKQHGVKKIFRLSEEIPAFGEKQRAYLTTASLTKVKWFCNQARVSVESEQPGVYHLILSPRATHAVYSLLEEEGFYGLVTVSELNPGFFLLDDDLLSMEMPQVFPECFVHGDQVNLFPFARALCELQQVFGRIPHVFGHGRFSAKVKSLIDAIFVDIASAKGGTSSACEIGYLFIFDRDVDYPSVLLTQLTYAGLLDEVMGINCGVVEFSPLAEPDKPVKMSLNGATPRELRDAHFSTVGSTLSRQIKELGAKQTPKPEISVQEMKRLVKEELKVMQAERKRLSDHVAASEIITKTKGGARFQEQLGAEHCCVEGVDFRDCSNFIQEKILMQSDLHSCLRLLSLFSFCQGGIPAREARQWKTRFTHAFGYDKLPAFHELRKLGLWSENPDSAVPSSMVSNLGVFNYVGQSKMSGFRTMVKKLALIPPPPPQGTPAAQIDSSDVSYVFGGGYTPAIVKIVEQVIKTGKMASVEDSLKWCPGETFPSSSTGAGGSDGVKFTSLPASFEAASRVALVCFVGGVTFAEVAAFRLLGRKLGKRFIIATTHVTNGNMVMKSVLE